MPQFFMLLIFGLGLSFCIPSAAFALSQFKIDLTASNNQFTAPHSLRTCNLPISAMDGNTPLNAVLHVGWSFDGNVVAWVPMVVQPAETNCEALLIPAPPAAHLQVDFPTAQTTFPAPFNIQTCQLPAQLSEPTGRQQSGVFDISWLFQPDTLHIIPNPVGSSVNCPTANNGSAPTPTGCSHVTNAHDAGSGSLREAIACAEEGDTVTFDAPLTGKTINLQSEITVNKALSIDGGNLNIKIDGQRLTRHFVVFSDSTFKNLTLQNGLSSSGSTNPANDRGGAVRVHSGYHVTFEQMTFLNNEAGGYGGGAIGGTGTHTKITIRNSTFIGNQSRTNSEKGSGAIALFAGGDAHLTIEDSNFENNQGVNGGAIGSSAALMVRRSQFKNNHTLAAINYASNSSSPRGSGGAIYTDRPDEITLGHFIEESLFEGNQGLGTGGAVFIFINGGQKARIAHSIFRNNTVGYEKADPNDRFSPKGYGGAVFFGMNAATSGESSQHVITHSLFENNTAIREGGAVWLSRLNSNSRVGRATVLNSTFVGNQAIGSTQHAMYGGAITSYFPTQVINSTFSQNHAGTEAGAIATNSSVSDQFHIYNSIFDQNTAISNTKQQANFTFSGSHNIQNNGSTNADAVVTGIIFADPLLQALADNGGKLPTIAIAPTSPAIDAGDNAQVSALEFDQRGNGFNRIQNGTVDLGAFER